YLRYFYLSFFLSPLSSLFPYTTLFRSVSMRAFIATEYRETFIEVYINEPERILVTCVEVLSPSNKRRETEGWQLYLRKRQGLLLDRKSTRLNSSHGSISYAVFCLKKKN